MESNSKQQINWQTNVLPKETQKALEFFKNQKWLKNSEWYLAGGTGLALQAGHRSSVDLDFFTLKKNINNNMLLLKFPKEWKTTVSEQGTIYGEIYKAKVSFIVYPFFIPKLPLLKLNNIKVLQSKEIALMKIITISQRGKKRDFFDLYWCCLNIAPLKELILSLKEQYPSIAHNYHHILKSLVYFDDADNDPLPRILFDADWHSVKKFFRQEVLKITKEILKIH
ncbi:nucleotidyl transferase AbiEii/AbiGii toxin family protein [Patescibacteria group bacterium]|nr:nucleotidyl transferase AbiEii/AbiGii toxin family protein [Patescibacteria group bacterium]MBU4023361.1 nucleotidyl transferase AbiEii/AbiGii toxin family protein [Patescibacteria group bacterium]MBU4078543.1 nucleotidyl transferase AbiEii/AbiGii toxin family protein [Patescibacteria group bacterium]